MRAAIALVLAASAGVAHADISSVKCVPDTHYDCVIEVEGPLESVERKVKWDGAVLAVKASHVGSARGMLYFRANIPHREAVPLVVGKRYRLRLSYSDNELWLVGGKRL